MMVVPPWSATAGGASPVECPANRHFRGSSGSPSGNSGALEVGVSLLPDRLKLGGEHGTVERVGVRLATVAEDALGRKRSTLASLNQL
jgi:hypothetical protein